MTRTVVDTNVVISRFLSPTGTPARVFDHWRQEAFELLVSDPILEEYRRALGYERVRARHRMTDEEIDQAVADLRQLGVLVEPEEPLDVIKDDPADNKFLECAI